MMKTTVRKIRKKLASAVPMPPPICRTKPSAAAGFSRSCTGVRPVSMPMPRSQPVAEPTIACTRSWYPGKAV